MARVTLGTDTSGRPLVVDDRTLAKLRAAEASLGFTFTIVQGSYRGSAGAAASAGTHDGGGVIDLRTWNLGSIAPETAVLHLRRAGLIAWYRTTAQGFDPHIHAIDYGNPWLSPAAVVQVRAWERGENGLASGGADDGPRVPIPTDPPEEDDMAQYEAQLKSIEGKLDALLKQEKGERTRDKADRERWRKLRQEVRAGKRDVKAALEEALAELEDPQ